MTPAISVVIPTYERIDILAECLAALERQTLPHEDYEILVVDDGSSDETEERLPELIAGLSCAARTFRQANSGPAAARNVGIRNARGRIVLFMGDDILAEPDLLERHLACYEARPDREIGVLGYVTWCDAIEVTPFMRWLEEGGPQFAYWKIDDAEDIDPARFFYTANVSVRREFLVENDLLFDEEFRRAACEDTELGSRMGDRGLRLVYAPEAVGYHHHYTSLDSSCRRMLTVGESILLLNEKLGRQEAERSSLSLRWEILWRRTLAGIHYPFARFFEKRRPAAKCFRRLMKHQQAIGSLRARLSRARSEGSALPSA